MSSHDMHENARRSYMVAFYLFLLAAISKPMAITFPVVLLILDWFPLQRLQTSDGRRMAVVEKTPFIMVSLALAGMAFYAQKSAHAMPEHFRIPLVMKIMNAVKALIDYLIHMVLPFDLMPFYPHPYWVDPVLTSPQYLLPALAVVLISICSIILIKKQPLWFAIWASYVIMLLPVLGIVQVGAHGMADRYTYLPSVGPFMVIGIATGWAAGRIVASGIKKSAWPSLIIAVGLFTVLVSSITIKQIQVWKNGITLWSHELDILEKTSSQDIFVIGTAYSGKGLAHMMSGSYEDAVDDYSKTILLIPNVEYHQERAIAYAKLGRLEEALQDFTSAISLDPTSASLYYNRGTAYAKRGSFSEAIDDLSKAISLSTEPNADYYLNRGNALKKLGRLDEGERDIIAARKLNRRSPN